MSLYIPPIVKVGSIERADTFEGKLSFVIPSEKSGKKFRQQDALDGWLSRNKHIDTVVFDNVPSSGFFINKSIKRVSYSSFGGTTNKMRIYSNRGFEFEVDMSCVAMIATSCDISKGEIKEECILAWDGKNVVLLPVSSVEYMEYVQSNELLKAHKEDLKSGAVAVEVGDVLKFKDSEYVYAGKYSIVDQSDVLSGIKRNQLKKTESGWSFEINSPAKNIFLYNFPDSGNIDDTYRYLSLNDGLPTGKNVKSIKNSSNKFKNIIKKIEEKSGKYQGNLYSVFDPNFDVKYAHNESRNIYNEVFKMVKSLLKTEETKTIKKSGFVFQKSTGNLINVEVELTFEAVLHKVKDQYLSFKVTTNNQDTGEVNTVTQNLNKKNFPYDLMTASRSIYYIHGQSSYSNKSMVFEDIVKKLKISPKEIRCSLLFDFKVC